MKQDIDTGSGLNLAERLLDFMKIDKKQDKGASETKKIAGKDIAIIGMAGKFPLADNLEQYWDNLLNRVDCIRSLPESRKVDVNHCLNRFGADGGIGVMGYPEYGYLEEIDKFDYGFFHLSPQEARLIDPNQRIFLETAWNAIADAGYGGGKLNGSRTGIYIGFRADDFYDYRNCILDHEPSAIVSALTGNMTSFIGSRISYLLDLKGPCLAIDTACSSSLTAVHVACRAIQNRECDMAIAGTVRLNILPLDFPDKLGIESSDGRAKTFDEAADGTGMGEGAAAILLKPLHKAIRDGDQIYAVIKGSAVNQDGSSVGITAPNVLAQEELLVRAWEDANIEPETVSYMEAHGTGTKLGDPIEIEGIQRAFRRYTDKKQFCAVGAVKTNIGHLDNAAGMAGLMKAILALKHGILPPSLHFNRPNRRIQFEESPVYVLDQAVKWETEGSLRRCGISAFALSGTNCHIVLEEYPDGREAAPDVPEGPDSAKDPAVDRGRTSAFHVLTLSAKSETALQQLIEKYHRRMQENCNLGNLCYTANTGRDHYSHRLAMVLEDRPEEIRDKFEKLSSGGISALREAAFQETGLLYGTHKLVPSGKEFLEAGELDDPGLKMLNRLARDRMNEFIAAEKKDRSSLLKLGELYVKGAEIDWNLLYQGESRKRISLPGYPFEKRRCWVKQSPKTQSSLKELAGLLERIPLPDEYAGAVKEALQKWQAGLETAGAEAQAPGVQLTGRPNAQYSELEEETGRIWSEVLGIERLSIDDNFFDLGGDSILAMKIVNRLNLKISGSLEQVEIFKYPTIRELGLYLDERPPAILHNQESDSLLKSKVEDQAAGPEFEPYEASIAQKRLFILNQLDDTGVSYNIPGALQIEGKLDLERLTTAIKRLIQRQAAFRTSFQLIGGELKQCIQRKAEFVLNYRELEESNEVPLNFNTLAQEFIQPFDLSRAPLFRIEIIGLVTGKGAPARRYLFMYDMHHIISDAFSINIFTREMMGLYLGQEPPELKVQFHDFSERQNELLRTKGLHEQEKYWLTRFAGEIPLLNLPTDYPRPPVRSFAGGSLVFKMDLELTARLKQLAAATKSTLYMVLLSIYNVLLSKYSGQEDISVGLSTGGRPGLDFENVIGMFVNTLVMRNYPIAGITFQQFLHTVKLNALKAYENQDYQLDALLSKLNLTGDSNRPPVFETMFTLQNDEIGTIEGPGLRITQAPFENKATKFDINLKAVEKAGEISFSLDYSACLFRRETMETLSRRFIMIARTVVENPEIKLADIKTLTIEQETLIYGFTDNLEDE